MKAGGFFVLGAVSVEEEPLFSSGLFAFLTREFSELRRRLLWCVGCLLVVSCLLMGLPHWQDSYVMRLAAWVQQALLPGNKPVFLDPLEPMMVMFKISVVVSVALCLPLLAYHFAAFTLPALDKGYKNFYLGFIAAAVGLLALGLAVTSVLFLPLTVKMLVDYGRAAGGLPQITFDRFYSFIFLFLLAFSLPFEAPLVMGFLHRFNLVPLGSLKAMRLKVYGVLVILSQFVTPDPILTPTLFIAETILLYESGLLLCRWL
jgi:sec-independent protein translocase protein TatC